MRFASVKSEMNWRDILADVARRTIEKERRKTMP